MKIIYYHQYFNTPENSGGTRSYEMARRLVNYGHEVHIVTSRRDKNTDKKKWSHSIENGIHVHWFPVHYDNNMRFIRRMIAFLQFVHACGKLKISTFQADLVFSSSTPLTIAIPSVLASRKIGVPFVLEIRDLWPELPIAIGALKNPFLKFAAHSLEKWAYRNARGVIALSPGMKDGIVKKGYPSKCIGVIPNGCDRHEALNPISQMSVYNEAVQKLLNVQSPFIIYAGTLGQMNGVDYLVQLAIELKRIHSNLKVVVVGDGKMKERLLRNARALSVLDDYFIYQPRVPKASVWELFQRASFSAVTFIDIPAMYSNSSNKFFDSLAAGIPVVINFGGWMDSLINRYKCGISLFGVDAATAARKLDYVLSDTTQMLRLGQNARVLGELHFDRDIQAEQLNKILSSVLAGRHNDIESIAPGKYL